MPRGSRRLSKRRPARRRVREIGSAAPPGHRRSASPPVMLAAVIRTAIAVNSAAARPLPSSARNRMRPVAAPRRAVRVRPAAATATAARGTSSAWTAAARRQTADCRHRPIAHPGRCDACGLPPLRVVRACHEGGCLPHPRVQASICPLSNWGTDGSAD